MNLINLKILICICFFSFCQTVMGQNIEIKITNIKSEKGHVCLAFFESDKEFKNEKPKFELKSDKHALCNGTISFYIPYHKGTVGVSVLDDENADGRMNYKLISIPREGFGFSNYFHKGIFKPKFDDFSFVLKANETKKVEIKMKYFD